MSWYGSEEYVSRCDSHQVQRPRNAKMWAAAGVLANLSYLSTFQTIPAARTFYQESSNFRRSHYLLQSELCLPLRGNFSDWKRTQYLADASTPPSVDKAANRMFRGLRTSARTKLTYTLQRDSGAGTACMSSVDEPCSMSSWPCPPHTYAHHTSAVLFQAWYHRRRAQLRRVVSS